MRSITNNIIDALMILITIDLLIVMTGLTQIILEERSGHWAPFWRVQAEFILQLIN
jgi:hypothetical protein